MLRQEIIYKFIMTKVHTYSNAEHVHIIYLPLFVRRNGAQYGHQLELCSVPSKKQSDVSNIRERGCIILKRSSVTQSQLNWLN